MSGLLNRLVRQARSTLPTVQPLMPARFSGASSPQPETSSLEWHEQHLAEERSASAQPAPLSSRPQTPGGHTLRHPGGDDAPTGTITRPEANHDMRASTVAPPRPGLFPSESIQTPNPAATEDESGFAAQSAGRPSAASQDLAGFVPRTSAIPSAETPLPEGERAEFALEVRTAPRRDPAASPRISEAVPDGRPEIHISIGSIELRAVQPPSRPPQPLPFRPRVSLDDFLRGNREAES